jgi:hypothetical protein
MVILGHPASESFSSRAYDGEWFYLPDEARDRNNHGRDMPLAALAAHERNKISNAQNSLHQSTLRSDQQKLLHSQSLTCSNHMSIWNLPYLTVNMSHSVLCDRAEEQNPNSHELTSVISQAKPNLLPQDSFMPDCVPLPLA